MKYTKEQLEAKSDCELNCIIGKIKSTKQGVVIIVSGTRVFSTDVRGAFPIVDELDYCNNPSDMMPLVFEVGISLVKVGDGYVAFGDDYGYLDNQGTDLSIDSTDDPLSWSNEAVGHERPLRACAIAYILINQ